MKQGLTILSAVMLAACGGGPADDEGPSGLPEVVATSDRDSPAAASAPKAAAPAALTIACAPPGEAELREACAVDRLSDARGTVLTIRLPDGGFRRLRVSEDGRDVTAADGSQPARVTRSAGGVDVEVGGARFRLPARASGDAPG
jgi:hypothetical protein